MTEEHKEAADVSEDNTSYQALVEVSSDVITGGISALVGGLLAGPLGAALAGAATPGIKKTILWLGSEFSKRLLGPREEERVGYVIATVTEEVKRRLDSDELPRDDGFFLQRHSRPPSGIAVFEDLLIRSQREAEEKKLKYMAYLMAYILFSNQISTPLAHQLIKTAGALSYRQFCIMSLSADKAEKNLRPNNYRETADEGTHFTHELIGILAEYVNLDARGLVNFDGDAVLGLTDVNPGKATLQGLGTILYQAMRLNEIPDSDIVPLVHHLR